MSDCNFKKIITGSSMSYFHRVLATACLIASAPAFAADTYQLDIGPQQLSAALRQFAQQSGLQVVYYGKVAEGLNVAGIAGKLTADQALKALLSGTDLQYETLDQYTFAISAAAPAEKTSARAPRNADGVIRLASAQSSSVGDRASRSDAASASSAGAQERSPPAQERNTEGTLEEITVRAQRRDESIQDVPISVTAFSGAAIEARGISEAKDYFLFTPNVSFTEDGQTGSRSVGISIRGVSNLAIGEQTVSNGFGFYVDELNVASVATGVINPQLQDIEVIEVLRGPQGTYFGRNAAGGAINITTRKPGPEPYSQFDLGFGRYNTWSASGIVNAPVTDRLFVRALASFERSDGMIKNVFVDETFRGNPTNLASGLPNPRSGDEYDHYNFRGAVRYLPTDALTLDLSVTYARDDDGADSNVNSGVLDLDTMSTLFFADVFRDLLPYDGGVGFFPRNTRYVNKNEEEFNRGELTILNGRINYDFGAFKLSSITGYVDSEHRRRFDQDVSPFADIVRDLWSLADSFSQELRLTTTLGPVDLTVGGLYAEDEFNRYAATHAGLNGLQGFVPPGLNLGSPGISRFEGKSVATFVDATWHATDRLDLILGGRYTRDRIRQEIYNDLAIFTGNVPKGLAPNNSGDSSFNDFSPRLSLSYEMSDDSRLYATASRGYKAGGIQLNNPQILAQLPGRNLAEPFDPEELWNYELGFKAELLDHRLRANAAIFYIDWKDVQTESATVVSDPNDPTTIRSFTDTFNIDVKIKGIELETSVVLTRGLTLSAGVGYLDSSMKDFTYNLQGMTWDLDGQPLPRAPEWTLNAAGQYDFTLGTATDSWVRLEWAHRSKSYSDLEALASGLAPIADPSGVQADLGVTFPRPPYPFQVPAFDVVNLRAGVERGSWSLTAYVENLLEENYYTGTQENFGYGGIRLRPHPRQWGLRVSFKVK
jgi:iron complex outermembrane recepter protein